MVRNDPTALCLHSRNGHFPGLFADVMNSALYLVQSNKANTVFKAK